MATNKTLKDDIINSTVKKENSSSVEGITLATLLKSDSIKNKFESVLEEGASQFLISISNLVNGDKGLREAEPISVLSSCFIAASLNLPIEKNLGYAWIIPYNGKATFQIGYKGYVQLALRTGEYTAINVVSIREGELIRYNPLLEEIELDFNKVKSDVVIGYAAHFKLKNGFTKTVYWTVEDIINHAKKYSPSFNNKNSLWKTDFDKMAKKTVLKNLLSKWGILSVKMNEAYMNDMVENSNNELFQVVK